MVNLDKAQLTPCVENGRRDGVRRVLPWAFARLGDIGEGRDYVVPRSPVYGGDGGLGPAVGVTEVAQTAPEYMPFRPFPVETGRGTEPDSALHFFGMI